MMTMDMIRQQLPDYAKDIKLNMGQLFLEEDGAEGLTVRQLASVSLACALALGDADLTAAIRGHFSEQLGEEQEQGIRTAVSLMAMNNVYYRSVHLIEQPAYRSLPPRLRMQGLKNHGIDLIEFELAALAVSAVNGCGLCLTAHVRQLEKAGVSEAGIQLVIKVAAVLNACSLSLNIKSM